MEHVYEESDDDTDSFCSDDFYSDDPNILSQDWLEECLTKEVKEIFVEKIFGMRWFLNNYSNSFGFLDSKIVEKWKNKK